MSFSKNKKTIWIVVGAIVVVVVVIAGIIFFGQDQWRLANPFGKTNDANNVSYEDVLMGEKDGELLSFDERMSAYSQIADDLEKELENDPENVELMMKLSSAYYNNGNMVKSGDILKKAVVLSPNDISLNLTLANVLRDTGQTEEAEKYYKKTLELDPQNVVAKSSLQALKK